ncbi:probable pseudouridine-5'-phosphatase isoform X4 [Choristoneura fumiferana]|uniref:probable pseudouridine-5'-phosphatase isoform X4 n=1 Tax=Choristoneura fumiferana TaxID=7141 RepID=UPI003D154D92
MIPGGKSFCTRHYKKVTHCLFDLDGTLLDSEVMYHTMIGQICEKYGKSYSKDNAVQIFGMTDREVSEEVCARTRLPLSVDEFERQLLDLARNKLPIAPEKPGADRLLTHLFDYKVPMALATNSTEQSVRLVSIARPKLFGMFNHMVSFSDPEVDRGKPHPDIYLVAASRFPDKPKPAQCIVFEDSEVGVQAAVAAGMQWVVLAGGDGAGPAARPRAHQAGHARAQVFA